MNNLIYYWIIIWIIWIIFCEGIDWKCLMFRFLMIITCFLSWKWIVANFDDFFFNFIVVVIHCWFHFRWYTNSMLRVCDICCCRRRRCCCCCCGFFAIKFKRFIIEWRDDMRQRHTICIAARIRISVTQFKLDKRSFSCWHDWK